MEYTSLICPTCKGTKFVEKGTEGKLLLHCIECQSTAKIEKAGCLQVSGEVSEKDSAIFPTVKEIRPKKEKSESVEIFEEISFRVPKSIKSLIQAALWCAKCDRQVTGAWFAGTVLGDIMTDYLGGFDFRKLLPADYSRVELLLQEASKSIETEEAKTKEFGLIEEEGRRGFHEKQIEKVVAEVIPQLVKIHGEKEEEVSKRASEGKEKQKVALHRGKILERLERGLFYLVNELEKDLPDEKREEYLEHLSMGEAFKGQVELGLCSPFDSNLKILMDAMEIPKKVYIRHKKEDVLIDSETGALVDDNFKKYEEELEEDVDSEEDVEDSEQPEEEEVAPVEEVPIIEETISPKRKKNETKAEKKNKEAADDFQIKWGPILSKIAVVELQINNFASVRADFPDIQGKVIHLREMILDDTISKLKAEKILKQVQDWLHDSSNK